MQVLFVPALSYLLWMGIGWLSKKTPLAVGEGKCKISEVERGGIRSDGELEEGGRYTLS